jgi:hypothetical protein
LRTHKVLKVVTVLLATLAGLPIVSQADGSVGLRAAFTPKRLGQGATVDLAIAIIASGTPPPLSEVSVRYPAGLGLALSGLGIDTCSAKLLESTGPQGCPADSAMGTGSALTEMQIGRQVLREAATVTVVRAPERNGRLAMLFYAAGDQPVIARTILVGELLPASRPYGGRIRITVPPVMTLPGQSIAIVRLHVAFGPPGLTYYESIHGKTIAYHPKDITLPSTCPHGGFPFSAQVAFLTGGYATADTTVPCPTGR